EAAMRHEPAAEDDEPGINLTPMVDVVFLLLIFYLAATTFTRDETRLDLRLPEAKSGERGQQGKPIVVDVPADGRIQVDGRDVTLVALQQKLTAARERDPDQAVLVRGDELARYGTGIAVLDTCRLAKIRKIDFATLPAKVQ
ncbi:MAG: biopolymer transporter ExbD, partial [Planctomycetota bacterium]